MFIEGEEYRRRELHAKFGGQQQGGISIPTRFPFIMIFTGDSGSEFGYSDGWQSDGAFYYTGEGQEGDMEFTKGNKAIRDHVKDGKDLHLFNYVRTGFVKYLGQMQYVGHHKRRSHDKNGNDRKAIVFELIKIQQLTNQSEETEDPVISQIDSLYELRQAALDSSSVQSTVSARIVHTRKRSEAIRLYALKRSQGVCEACNEPAPFLTVRNEPYLEVHHLRRLSDGGPDHPEWVAGICPTCHRRAHYAIDAQKFNSGIAQKIKDKEREPNPIQRG
ncbi:HNH endonuclease [Alicyclobacillus tolerans]|uniref:HNH endonuclease n=1 Tax=Alicyclobacillus tolerans TaxID=90970 RepID=UPI003B767356